MRLSLHLSKILHLQAVSVGYLLNSRFLVWCSNIQQFNMRFKAGRSTRALLGPSVKLRGR